MKCITCGQADTEPGKATVTLERASLTLVVKGVPAMVCPNCGEEYLDENTTRQLLRSAEEAASSGVQVEVRDYVASQAA